MLFLIVIPVISIVIFVIASKGQGFFDLRKKWYKSLTKRGWWIVSLNILIIILSVIQYFRNSEAEERQKIQNKKDQDDRDSIITARVKIGIDSGNKHLFNGISEAFTKRDLYFDSLNKTVTSLKPQVDASKQLVRAFNAIEKIYMDRIQFTFNEPLENAKRSGKMINEYDQEWNIGFLGLIDRVQDILESQEENKILGSNKRLHKIWTDFELQLTEASKNWDLNKSSMKQNFSAVDPAFRSFVGTLRRYLDEHHLDF